MNKRAFTFPREWKLELTDQGYLCICQCGDFYVVKTVNEALDALNHECLLSLGEAR